MKKADDKEHKLLALWAADCAKHVLSLFEQYYPEDDRPRQAIDSENEIEGQRQKRIASLWPFR